MLGKKGRTVHRTILFFLLFLSIFSVVSVSAKCFENWCCDNEDYIPIEIIDSNTGYCCPPDMLYLTSDKQSCLSKPEGQEVLISCLMPDEDVYRDDKIFNENFDLVGCKSGFVCQKFKPDGVTGFTLQYNRCVEKSSYTFWDRILMFIRFLFSKFNTASFIKSSGGSR
jgi:hypothetical protein